MPKLIDLTGKKYGYLTVIRREGRNSSGTTWLCECKCGKQKVINGKYLKNGKIKSCGCLTNQLYAETIKERKLLKTSTNNFVLLDNYYIGYTSNGDIFYFDKEDYEKISKISWCVNSNGYLCGRCDGKDVLFHKFILESKEIIDHINHNKLDNRKENLRIVSKSQNGMNSRIYKNNTSGHKGISYIKDYNKWMAYIMINGKLINLGYYDNKNDAIKNRESAEIQYFGEYNYNINEDYVFTLNTAC